MLEMVEKMDDSGGGPSIFISVRVSKQKRLVLCSTTSRLRSKRDETIKCWNDLAGVALKPENKPSVVSIECDLCCLLLATTMSGRALQDSITHHVAL